MKKAPFIALGVAASPCAAQVALVASGSIAADAHDLSGLRGTVGGVPHDQLTPHTYLRSGLRRRDGCFIGR